MDNLGRLSEVVFFEVSKTSSSGKPGYNFVLSVALAVTCQPPETQEGGCVGCILHVKKLRPGDPLVWRRLNAGLRPFALILSLNPQDDLSRVT